MSKAGKGMTPVQLEALCGAWPGVTRDIKWGADLVFSVGGKMFAVMPADPVAYGHRLGIKVADERFLELTDQPGIVPSPYLARAHWVSVVEPQRFATAELAALVRDSYVLVRAKLTKKLQKELGPLPPA
ncbi:MmcQ/YjbR family DNA-binding protein [Dyella sp. BiH032]|uniref:MmcQ/YjbR family DNA-binding protein n=1 Tax=Dyella sp. BiH032 TaxID=3075430 RepID=UPI0028937B35|nr:MmcQ/YjbR family DNA-binding protein [Dyella sp. BiH032]WNL47485.1 MmcQ/YjbR family DNA-binding protein [Dyella sp. BiH032]